MMSIVFNHYKILKDRWNSKKIFYSKEIEYNINQNSIILERIRQMENTFYIEKT
jgi:hypothetical protein